MRKDGSSSARSATRRAIAKSPDGLDNALAAARSLIAEVERDLDRDLAAVLAGLDWSDPRLAFYGETNAGKSTLIEALRLILAVHGETPGSKIGDGSPDFTRRTTTYPCEIDGTRFSLVDVPGIEGNEANVAADISAALRSAHLVFLVVGEARPPQGGDGESLGTLEKIARDLRPQAKVWAVFNKRITNPRQLADQLVDDDELRGLTGGSNSLDGKLRVALGDRYQRHVCVSAMPGFFAVAGVVAPCRRWART